MHTDTSISENAANSSQVSGIQTFAIANSVANSTANKCKQHNSPKTVNSANRLNALENIGQMGENGKFSVQQCSHAGEVNDYAIHNSGMRSWALDKQLPYQIFYQVFGKFIKQNLVE